MDLLRRALDTDHRVLATSPRWRTYVALRATVAGLRRRAAPGRDGRAAPHGGGLHPTQGRGLRDPGRARGLPARRRPHRAGRLPCPLGRARRDEHGVRGAGAVRRAAGADPGRLARGRAPGTAHVRSWTVPSLATAMVVFAFLEPDPDVTWDDARVAAVRAAAAAADASRIDPEEEPC